MREAAVAGFATLVDNPLAQPLLKVMLPMLKSLIWDSALAVRVTMADLLLAVG